MTIPERPGEPHPAKTSGISRRGFLGTAAAVTGAAVIGGIVGNEFIPRLVSAPPPAPVPTSPPAGPPATPDHASAAVIVPFRGPYQAGIATPAQDRLAIAAFDIVTDDRAAVVDMLQRWTAAAERMSMGQASGEVEAAQFAPSEDTGEAVGLSAARLTLTVGFGPSFFDGRFGLKDKRPSALIDLPAFRREVLKADLTGGDLVVQACADDPQVAFHAVRNLARFGRGVVVVRWFQLGFGRTSSTSSAQATPRNLMGFKDGTNNIVAEDTAAMASQVWVDGTSDQPWMTNGTYMVTRRIRMLIEAWDRTSFDEQQRVFGRTKVEGAPIGGHLEHDTVDLQAKDSRGDLAIAQDAHIRLAAPSVNDSKKLLRRGYSFTDGMDPVTGELDAGLFFIAFQRDPATQFVPIQNRLSQSDSLNEYIKHTGSGIFACPPGVGAGGWWGETLLRS